MSSTGKNQTRAQSPTLDCQFSISLLQQFTRSLTYKVTEPHTYKQKSCLAKDEGAHLSSSLSLQVSPLSPQESWLLVDPIPKAFWDKLVYTCLPAWKSGLHLSCGLLLILPSYYFCKAAGTAALTSFWTQYPGRRLLFLQPHGAVPHTGRSL